MAAGERMEVMENEVVRRVAVSSIARLGGGRCCRIEAEPWRSEERRRLDDIQSIEPELWKKRKPCLEAWREKNPERRGADLSAVFAAHRSPPRIAGTKPRPSNPESSSLTLEWENGIAIERTHPNHLTRKK